MRDGCGRAEGGRGESRNSGRGVANWEGWAQEDLRERARVGVVEGIFSGHGRGSDRGGGGEGGAPRILQLTRVEVEGSFSVKYSCCVGLLKVISVGACWKNRQPSDHSRNHGNARVAKTTPEWSFVSTRDQAPPSLPALKSQTAQAPTSQDNISSMPSFLPAFAS